MILFNDIHKFETHFKLDHRLVEVFSKGLKDSLDFENGPWLAGGSLLRWYKNEMDADYDIACTGEEQARDYEHRLLFNGYTLSKDTGYANTYGNGEHTIQVIKCVYSDLAEDVIGKHDFTITQWITDLHVLGMGDTTFNDVINKRIITNLISNPVITVHRVNKYFKRGYQISSEEVIKILQTPMVTIELSE